jgi:hypothetical protein
MQLIITELGGNCPVQGYGTIDGVPFYFRARGEHWSMSIGGPDPVDIACGYADGWYKEEELGDEPYAAGWMEEAEARRLIEQCAQEYADTVKADGP